MLHALRLKEFEVAAAQRLKSVPVACLHKMLCPPEGHSQAACDMGSLSAVTSMAFVRIGEGL